MTLRVAHIKNVWTVKFQIRNNEISEKQWQKAKRHRQMSDIGRERAADPWRIDQLQTEYGNARSEAEYVNVEIALDANFAAQAMRCIADQRPTHRVPVEKIEPENGGEKHAKCNRCPAPRRKPKPLCAVPAFLPCEETPQRHKRYLQQAFWARFGAGVIFTANHVMEERDCVEMAP